MKPFWDWANDNGRVLNRNEDGNIPLEEFERNGLPMIVECTACTMTFLLPNGFIDEDGHTYCCGCGADA